MKTVIGYANEVTIRPQRTVTFHISAYAEGSTDAHIVRLIGCDNGGPTPTFAEEEVDAPCNGKHDIGAQPIDIGSCGIVPAFGPWLSNAAQVKVTLWIRPSALQLGPQTVLSCGTALELYFQSDRRLVARLGDTEVKSDPWPEKPLWTEITVQMNATKGDLRLDCAPIATTPGAAMGCKPQSYGMGGAQPLPLQVGEVPLIFAAGPVRFERNSFFGRIEAPSITVDGQVVATWDFSKEIESLRMVDTGPNALHGALENMPTRAVPGWRWDGSVHDWRVNPSHYGAIHFHGDDLADAQWLATLSWTPPPNTRSGVYALRLRQGSREASGEHYIPIFVAPPRGQAGSDVCYLASTATYAAYANMASLLDLKDFYPAMRFDHAGDDYIRQHREIGLSHYDHHLDGHGVMHSSLRRPIVNMTAKGASWSLTADGAVTAWLERAAGHYDVVTDDLVHTEGADLLSRYLVLVTGTHPEYWSSDMMKALRDFQSGGGRIMYMGGNGFYWRITYHPEAPYVVECRRAEDGTRAWIAEPGSYHHQGNGELGGLWRRLGQPPQALVGVGFAAQGFAGSSAYLRQPGANDPRAAFILDGVEALRFGDFGAQGGGAAGEELDRADALLGTPAHALIIASSEPCPGLLRVKEELFQNVPTDMPDPEIRADMVFFETPNGGAVWSTGSIAWAGALAHNNYDNEIAQITQNVLNRFRDPAPFPGPI